MGLDKRIRILVIVNAIFGYDGISNVAVNYYHYQNKSKVQMDLLTINDIPDYLKREIEDDGNRHFVVTERNRNPIGYIVKIKDIVSRNKYDIVYIHGNSATMAIDLLGAKLGGCKVRVAHSHNTQCDHQKINNVLMPVFSKLYTDCCACSIEAGQFLFKSKECYVVNNGISPSKYEFSNNIRERIRKKYGLDGKFVIGHIGRFSYQKNQEFLLPLLRELLNRGQDAMLLLVGNGETIEKIKGLAYEWNLVKHVVFYGTTDHINEVLQAMDCFVFPSRFEGLGIVAIEAQAAGLKCVISEEVPKTVNVMKNSRFISLQQPLSRWADLVIEQRNSADERQNNVERTRERIKEAGFDIEENCKDMLNYYMRILKVKRL